MRRVNLPSEREEKHGHAALSVFVCVKLSSIEDIQAIWTLLCGHLGEEENRIKEQRMCICVRTHDTSPSLQLMPLRKKKNL